MDGHNIAAMLALPVYFYKAFNIMLHSDVLCNFNALNVPICKTPIIKSYLTRRSICVRYKGAESSFKDCPGGGPQGGLLTRVLFSLTRPSGLSQSSSCEVRMSVCPLTM